MSTLDFCGTGSPFAVCLLSWCMILISWFIIAPIMIYYTIQFRKYSSHPGIRSRHPLVTLTMMAVCLLMITVIIPIRYMEGTMFIFRESQQFAFITYLFSISILMLSYCGIWRVWMVYFDVCWLQSNVHQNWAQMLNPDLQLSFFSRTKSTWGSDIYVGKIAAAIILCFCIIYALVNYYIHHHTNQNTKHFIFNKY